MIMKKIKYLILLFLILPIIVSASDTVNFKVGNRFFESFFEAYQYASLDNPLIILNDINFDDTLNINKSIEINLNNHDISSTRMVFKLDGGTLNLTGKGTVRERNPYYGAVVIKGSETNQEDYSILNVSSDVTLEGWTGIFIDQKNKKAYGVKVNSNAKINALNDTSGDSGIGIYVNGQIKDSVNAPEINLGTNSYIKSTGPGIYLAGYSTLNVDGYIEGIDSGLSLKSGIININGGTIKATGPDNTPTSPNGNGTNSSGAGIQIESNNSYAGNIELTINDGNIISENGYSFYEFTATPSTNTKVKEINILNGTFTSLKNNFLLSDSFKTTHPKFVSGGKFTSDVSPYLKTGSLSYNDNYYQVVSKNFDNIKDLTISKKNLLPIIIIITFLIVVLINLYLYTRKKLLKKKNK